MKSIDIQSDSAVNLLAEFMDMDQPYVEGGRYVNAEHFTHGKHWFLVLPLSLKSSLFHYSDQMLGYF